MAYYYVFGILEHAIPLLIAYNVQVEKDIDVVHPIENKDEILNHATFVQGI